MSPRRAGGNRPVKALDGRLPPALRLYMNPKFMATRTSNETTASIGTAMLEQFADLDAQSMSAETARQFLQITFKPSHKQRVRVLSEKARKGTLLTSEEAELDEFVRVADLLAILHSKARQVLKYAGLSA